MSGCLLFSLSFSLSYCLLLFSFQLIEGKAKRSRERRGGGAKPCLPLLLSFSKPGRSSLDFSRCPGLFFTIITSDIELDNNKHIKLLTSFLLRTLNVTPVMMIEGIYYWLIVSFT